MRSLAKREMQRRFSRSAQVHLSPSYDQIFLHETHVHRQSPDWSGTLSYATPETDFVGKGVVADKEYSRPAWSHSLSYATPEADFVAHDILHDINENNEDKQTMIDFTYLAPQADSAIGFVHQAEFLDTSTRDSLLLHQGYSHKSKRMEENSSAILRDQDLLLNFGMVSSPESAAGFLHAAEVLEEKSKGQLESLQQKIDSLPKTIEEALADPRAVVVTSTSTPFDVVDVNDAWVGLCGYSREEAVNQSLGAMLQGPETSIDEANYLVSRLNRDHYSEALITNYTKSGRQFTNHVQVGIISESFEDQTRQFFVGVLTEVDQSKQMQGSM
jgi:PAS domain S-box-containing protein